ncbi:MAG: DUF6242 domain-containing protein [Prevotella sp.]
MKYCVRPIYLLLSVVLLFVACVDDDNDEIVLYNDIAITGFQITSGTVSGVEGVGLSHIPFAIDHRFGEPYGKIENTTPLPYGTDPATLLCGYYTKNNALVFIEDQVTGEWQLLMSTETQNFSSTRYLHVMSSDNTAERTYELKVNVYKEKGDEFVWNRLADESGFAAMEAMKAFTVGGKIMLFGKSGTETTIHTADAAETPSWQKSDITFGADAYRNVAVQNDTVYVLDGVRLMRSVDMGATYSELSYGCVPADAGFTLKQLLGAGTTEIYALTDDGKIAVSKDKGATWTPDAGAGADADDEDMEWLPAEDITFSSAPFAYNDKTDYMVLAGNRASDSYPSDSKAVVWRKIVEYSQDSHAGKWTYMTPDDATYYQLPRLGGLTVFAYDGRLLAVGGAGKGGCTDASLAQIYESRDGGITWKTDTSYALPSALDRNIPAFAITVDADNYIWIVCAGTGQVWKGRLNRLGWTN